MFAKASCLPRCCTYMRPPRKSFRNYVQVSVRAAWYCHIYSTLAHGAQLQATTPTVESGHWTSSIDHTERCVMPYDRFQRTFALSSLANWVSTRSGPQSVLQADCQQMLTDTVSLSSNQQVIGNWQLVWGRRSGRRRIRCCPATSCMWRIPLRCRAPAGPSGRTERHQFQVALRLVRRGFRCRFQRRFRQLRSVGKQCTCCAARVHGKHLVQAPLFPLCYK